MITLRDWIAEQKNLLTEFEQWWRENHRRSSVQFPVSLDEGEFIVVPRGVEHKPVADEECWIMLFEPASTLNTGNVENEFTLKDLERV